MPRNQTQGMRFRKSRSSASQAVRRPRDRWGGLPSSLGWAAVCCGLVAAAAGNSQADETIRKYQTSHFELHTDLTVSEVSPQLKRMERGLAVASNYWGRKLPGQIRCYLIADLKNWSEPDLPARHARRVLRRVGGGTDLEARGEHPRAVRQAVIYATTEPGILEHEVIHAYCFQTFGRGGPDWYREGIAEVLAHEARELTREMKPCRPETVTDLRRAASPRLAQVLDNRQFTASLKASILGVEDSPSALAAPQPAAPRSWGKADEDNLSSARIGYAQSWALCYLLYHNPSYRQRFQAWGQHVLSGNPLRFEQAFGPATAAIDFELQQFIENVELGYRFDLCRWQWKHDARELDIGQSTVVRLQACRGFQAAHVALLADQSYSIDAIGSWQLSPSGKQVDADGTVEGWGQLEAVVLNDYQLSEPRVLGRATTLKVTDPGHLYLRCFDRWQLVADHRGAILVRLTRQE